MPRISPALEQIKDILLEGRFEDAYREIKGWLKRHSPSAHEKIKLSEFYTWLGKEELSWKILGPPKTRAEIRDLDQDELCLQLRLAYCVGMLGSRYLAYRLIDAVSEHDLDLEKLYPQFYQNYGYLHISTYDYQKALWGFERAISLYPEESYQWFYIMVGISDSYCGLGRFPEAISHAQKLLTKIREPLLKATLWQVIGEYQNSAGLHLEAERALAKSADIYREEIKADTTKDYAYLLKHRGINAYFLGNSQQALEWLKEAKLILQRADQTPNSLREVNFWIEKIDPSETSLEEQISLRCYPQYSLYARLAGLVTSVDDKTPMPEWLAPYASVRSGDVWVVQAGKLESGFYERLDQELFQEGCIDLESSLWHKGGQEVEVLSPLQAELLLGLVGGGSRGVHEYLLLDRIYRQDFVEFQLGQDRLKKAMSELRKKGLNIKKDKMTYYWSETTDFRLVLPKDLITKDYDRFSRRVYPSCVSSKELAGLFQVSQRTAQRWIGRWRDEGRVREEEGKYYWSC